MESEAEQFAELGLNTAEASGDVHGNCLDGQAMLDIVPAIIFSAWLRGASRDEMLNQLTACLDNDIERFANDYIPTRRLSPSEKARFRNLGVTCATNGGHCEPWRHTNGIACRFEAYAAAHYYRRGYDAERAKNGAIRQESA